MWWLTTGDINIVIWHMSSRGEIVRATSEPQCAVLQGSQCSRCDTAYNQRYELARGSFRGRGSSYHSIVSGPPASREWPATRGLWTTSMTTRNSETWNDKRYLAKQPLHVHGVLISALCSRTWARGDNRQLPIWVPITASRSRMYVYDHSEPDKGVTKKYSPFRRPVMAVIEYTGGSHTLREQSLVRTGKVQPLHRAFHFPMAAVSAPHL